MDLEKQVEQLQAQIESKDSQIAALTRQTQELGAYKAEALNSRDNVEALAKKLADAEAAAQAAMAEAAAAKSNASTAASKKASDQKKVGAAVKMAEAVRELLG